MDYYINDERNVFYQDATGRKEWFAEAKDHNGAYQIAKVLNDYDRMLTERNMFQCLYLKSKDEVTE